MADSVNPTGRGGQVQPPDDNTGTDEPANIEFFTGMPFTKDEWDQFMQNQMKILSEQIKHEMKRMKEANAELRRSIEEQ